MRRNKRYETTLRVDLVHETIWFATPEGRTMSFVTTHDRKADHIADLTGLGYVRLPDPAQPLQLFQERF